MKVIKTISIGIACLWAVGCIGAGCLYVLGYRLYNIPTSAMQPTIMKGGIIVGCLSESYRSNIKRFDLVIYRTPLVPDQIYVKRVIGLSGERITVKEESVLIDGQKLRLPPAVHLKGLGKKKCQMLVPADEVFILGDYTMDSLDSRYIGPIAKTDVLGYVLFKE